MATAVSSATLWAAWMLLLSLSVAVAGLAISVVSAAERATAAARKNTPKKLDFILL